MVDAYGDVPLGVAFQRPVVINTLPFPVVVVPVQGFAGVLAPKAEVEGGGAGEGAVVAEVEQHHVVQNVVVDLPFLDDVEDVVLVILKS